MSNRYFVNRDDPDGMCFGQNVSGLISHENGFAEFVDVEILPKVISCRRCLCYSSLNPIDFEDKYGCPQCIEITDARKSAPSCLRLLNIHEHYDKIDDTRIKFFNLEFGRDCFYDLYSHIYYTTNIYENHPMFKRIENFNSRIETFVDKLYAVESWIVCSRDHKYLDIDILYNKYDDSSRPQRYTFSNETSFNLIELVHLQKK